MRRWVMAAAGMLAVASVPAFAQSSGHTPADLSGVKHPAWTKDAVIYQINTRQFTPQGNFKAAEKQLPRQRWESTSCG